MTVRRIALALAAVATLWIGPAAAHETDQYSVPVGREFVDLGDLWNRLLHEAVRRSVEESNAEIRRAMENSTAENRRSRLAALQSPDHLALKVRWQFPVGLLMIEEIEATLEREQQQNKHGGKLVMYRPEGNRATYNRAPWLPDPRLLTRTVVARASTIKVHNTFMGTDKFGHFIGWGYLYYLQYQASLGPKTSQEDALRAAVSIGNTNPVGEDGLHGMYTTGVYSNADLAANYVGLKFYVNLTEAVRLKGELCPPMLEREGELWKLAPHVRPDGRYFSLFISNHFDEALNPCLYETGMRNSVRGFVREHGAELLDWYAGDDPAKRNREWFDRTWQSLTTYEGEDYGQRGDENSLVLIGNTCFGDAPSGTSASIAKVAKKPAASAGRYSRQPVRHATRPAVAPVVKPFRDVQLTVHSQGPDVSLLQASSDFVIAVSNPGVADAVDVAVQLTVPRGLAVITLETPADYNAAQRTLTWQIPRVAAGELYELRFKARSALAGTHVQKVEVRSGGLLVAQDQHPLEVFRTLARQEAARGPVRIAISDEAPAE